MNWIKNKKTHLLISGNKVRHLIVNLNVLILIYGHYLTVIVTVIPLHPIYRHYLPLIVSVILLLPIYRHYLPLEMTRILKTKKLTF
jgi:hypothetical protein